MKTDAKTMAEIYRKMVDNIDAGIDRLDGIGYLQLKSQKWVKKETSVFDFENTQYCILPKTIIVNGVEIPKPLDISDVSRGIRYYKVSDSVFLYCSASADEITYGKFKFIYKTKEEAIEASKALFGIE